jgi:hypothetical protein
MRFLITKGPCGNDATKSADPANGFDETKFVAMMQYNEEMTRAGVLITAEGLKPDGVRVRVETSAGKQTVVDGPFTETKELLGGFYVIEVDTAGEAIGWAKRHPGWTGNESLEIRQLTELSDLMPQVQKLIAKSAPLWSSRLWRTKDSKGVVDPMPVRSSRS